MKALQVAVKDLKLLRAVCCQLQEEDPASSQVQGFLFFFESEEPLHVVYASGPCVTCTWLTVGPAAP